ncbi:MAG: hypothetical protein AB7I27_08075 [Bacteriovoracaceae bacterium]
MRILILLILILPAQVVAFQIERIKDSLVLKSEKCSEVEKVLLALNDWNANLKNNKHCQINSQNKIQRFEEGFGEDRKPQCKIDVTNCVPDHLVKYHGVNPNEKTGPNCWNLALVMKGILPALRFSSNEEMAFYMQPPLCRNLKNGEKRQAGDIGAIRTINGHEVGEFHGFIYLSDDVAYSKNGSEEDSWPYLLQSLPEMLSIYEVPNSKKCRSNEVDKTCDLSASYFRCISFEDYLKQHKNIPDELLKYLSTYSNYEQCLERELFNSSNNSNIGNLIFDTTKALTKYLSDERRQEENFFSNPEAVFVIGALQMRITSLVEQLQTLPEDSSSIELEDERLKLQKIIQHNVDLLKGSY